MESACPFLILIFSMMIVVIPCSAFDDKWSVNDPIHWGLVSANANKGLMNILRVADEDIRNLEEVKSLPMKYEIFRGRSALRDLPERDRDLILRPEELFATTTSSSSCCPKEETAHRVVCAGLLLLRGHADAAHEVLLGVTYANIEEAEYAATHPGETCWAENHPLSDSADLLHAAIHRLEGNAIGEGNHTGFENAKYWLAGGPKGLEVPAPHIARRMLASLALEIAPCCCSANSGAVVAGEGGVDHTIIGDGGTMRKVHVPEGDWDGFVFVDMYRRLVSGAVSPQEAKEIAFLQCAEFVLILRTELLRCL